MRKLQINLFMAFAVLFIAGIGATSAQAQQKQGDCNDVWVTQAIREVMARDPNGIANSGECMTSNYGGGSWSNYEDLKTKVRAYFHPNYIPVAAPYSGNCNDPWVTKVIYELIGRAPVGDANRGECYVYLYGNGVWSSYDDLKNKVRASLFNKNGKFSAMNFRCFGAQGSGCDALDPLAVGPYKAGRTNLGGGRYNMWISVGSIKHDNCCLAHPGGKMCGGNGAPSKDLFGNGDGFCVQEWDKAFWNAADGRAWSIEVNENIMPDLTIVTNPRSTVSRSGASLVFYETAQTRQYAAPAGQALDVGDEAFCQSGRAKTYNLPGTPKTWIICQ